MLLSMNFVGARNSVLRHQPRYLKLLLRVEFPRVANSFGRRSAAGEGRCDRQITTTKWLAGSQSFFKDFLDLALRSHLLHLIGVDQNSNRGTKGSSIAGHFAATSGGNYTANDFFFRTLRVFCFEKSARFRRNILYFRPCDIIDVRRIDRPLVAARRRRG